MINSTDIFFNSNFKQNQFKKPLINILFYINNNKINNKNLTYSLHLHKYNMLANLNFLKTSHYNFRYLIFNLFTFFFSKSKVTIPKVFLTYKKTNSNKNNIDTFKIVNYLMRDGKFIKTFKYIQNS